MDLRHTSPDWANARPSVERLAALGPAIAATGHGSPLSGQELNDGLDKRVRGFDRIAVPDHGR
jgi:hypothetical protein